MKIKGKANKSIVMNIAWVLSSPTPYKLPFFERLNRIKDINICFYFLTWASSTRAWSIEGNRSLKYKVMKGISVPYSYKEKRYIRINPGIIGIINKNLDLVIISGYHHPTMLIAIILSIFRRIPFVIQGESHVLKERSCIVEFFKRKFLYPLIRCADAAFATGTLSSKYWQNIGIPKDKIYIIANTPDVDYFKEKFNVNKNKKVILRRNLGLEDQRVGLFVGRFIKAKGVDILLQAMSLVPEEKRPIIMLVGDGPLEREYREYISANKLPVRIIGFKQKDELIDVFGAADFFILPSRREPWGVVVNEAMACGLPLLLSDKVGAAEDLLKNGENGFLIKSDNIDDCCKGLEKMVCLSSARLRDMGEKSRVIIENWKYDSSEKQFIECISNFIKIKNSNCE